MPSVTLPNGYVLHTKYDPAVVLAAIADYQRGHDGFGLVAARHGVAPSSLRNWLDHAGLLRSRAGGLRRKARALRDPEREERIVRLYDGRGMGVRQVASIVGASPETVRKVLRRRGVLRSLREAAVNVYEHPSRRLARERRERIVAAGRLRADGLTRPEIAAELGIGLATVQAYLAHPDNPYRNVVKYPRLKQKERDTRRRAA